MVLVLSFFLAWQALEWFPLHLLSISLGKLDPTDVSCTYIVFEDMHFLPLWKLVKVLRTLNREVVNPLLQILGLGIRGLICPFCMAYMHMQFHPCGCMCLSQNLIYGVNNKVRMFLCARSLVYV